MHHELNTPRIIKPSLIIDKQISFTESVKSFVVNLVTGQHYLAEFDDIKAADRKSKEKPMKSKLISLTKKVLGYIVFGTENAFYKLKTKKKRVADIPNMYENRFKERS